MVRAGADERGIDGPGLLLTEREQSVDSALGEVSPWIVRGDGRSAASLLSTIGSATITVAGVLFSVTMVALTLASNQFSPRILRNYMRDRVNQVVLGGFIATFAYCLLVLRSIQGNEDFVPAVAVTVGVVFALATLALLILFVHHIAQSIQVANILQGIAAETVGQIPHLYPDAVGEQVEDEPQPGIIGRETPRDSGTSRR
ncbi:MAG: DUF2254 domain-containing protein [Dehalococcoidia bacterium]|nr:DUF2254 domain-containing protein [Dehalococcoidia bacterium]